MTKPSIRLQDLRRRIYAKAKADTSWRFWGLFVHVCKTETLHEAYLLAKKNDGSPGVDGVSFEAIEAGGSSLRDFRQADGELGYFQHRFDVYGREAEACRSEGCRGVISRIVQSGRSTFYCPHCQR